MSHLPEILRKYDKDLLAAWDTAQLKAATWRPDLITERELHEQSRQFLRALHAAVQHGDLDDVTTPEWEEVREILADVSRARARQGFSPSETAMFVFSLKQPLFTFLRQELTQAPEMLASETWATTTLLDKLGLYTTEVYQQSREDMIKSQQQELLELREHSARQHELRELFHALHRVSTTVGFALGRGA